MANPGTDLAQLQDAAPEGLFLRRTNVMKRILALAGIFVAAAALSIGCQKKETTTTTTTQEVPSTSGTPEASTATTTTTTTTVEVTPTATHP
jgi:hypothetical protein